jgi:transposase
MKEQNSNLLYVKPQHHSERSSAPELSWKLLRVQAIERLPENSAQTESRSEAGENDFPENVSRVWKIASAPAVRSLFPSEALHQIIALATQPPEELDRPIPAWSITELTAEVHKQEIVDSISRSTVWRLLDQAEIKPHKWRYWLNSPDPEFESKMLHIVNLYLHPPENAVLLCLDEKTAIQALERKYPDIPMQPGQPCRREHSYIRHGTKDLLAAFEVSSGTVYGQLHDGHSSPYWEMFLKDLAARYSKDQKIHLIQDNFSTHSTPGLCRLIAELCEVPLPKLKTQKERRQWLMSEDKRIVFHYLPTHASWLNQIEIWFSTLSKRFLNRNSFHSLQELKEKIMQFIQYYNMEFAHPYAWTYTGKPLVAGNLVKNL